MSTYLIGRAHAARIAAYLIGRAHPRAQAAGRALAKALGRGKGESVEITLPDAHWSWIIGASASGH